MEINACIKNREPSFYLKNYSPIALLFKDKEELANHPLSCHPQGVFGSRESGRKGEKMKETRKEWELLKGSRLESFTHQEKGLCLQ